MTHHISMRTALAVVVIATAVLNSACDPAYTFTLVNNTEAQVRITYAITLTGQSDVLNERVYILAAGQAVDTGDDEDESGKRGASLFNDGREMHLRATRDDTLIIEKTFTFDELEALDFRIEITEGATPTPSATP